MPKQVSKINIIDFDNTDPPPPNQEEIIPVEPVVMKSAKPKAKAKPKVKASIEIENEKSEELELV